jgi:hypothetical protein
MKAYYSVIARQFSGDLWSIQFGDYDLECAKDEKEYMIESGEWFAVKVITSGDKQIYIDNEVNQLNASILKRIGF